MTKYFYRKENNMNNNNDWPFGEQDEFLAKFTSKSDVNTEEIFEEEDILTTIRLKSEAFGALYIF